jgi:hypothetical protein
VVLAANQPGNDLFAPADEVTTSFGVASSMSYSTWIGRYPSLVNSGALPQSDADRDGIPNLVEFATGGNPEVFSSDPLPSLGMGTWSGFTHLTLTIPKNPHAAGVSLRVESSSDLATWSANGTVTIEDTSTHLLLRDASPLPSSGKRFFRVRVEAP